MSKKTKTVATKHRGFDAAGHIAASEAALLLELARASGKGDTDEAFIVSAFTDDDLAEELAEAAVENMTSGEDHLTDELAAEVEEDLGGPFVETSANAEFAGGTDESNILEATREPFPTANGSGKA